MKPHCSNWTLLTKLWPLLIGCILGTTESDLLLTFGSRIDALSVLNGALEHVGELGLVAEEVGPDKVHHAPVLH